MAKVPQESGISRSSAVVRHTPSVLPSLPNEFKSKGANTFRNFHDTFRGGGSAEPDPLVGGGSTKYFFVPKVNFLPELECPIPNDFNEH